MKFSTILRPLFDTFNSMVSTASADELCRSTLTWLEQYCSLVALRPGIYPPRLYQMLARVSYPLTRPLPKPHKTLPPWVIFLNSALITNFNINITRDWVQILNFDFTTTSQLSWTRWPTCPLRLRSSPTPVSYRIKLTRPYDYSTLEGSRSYSPIRYVVLHSVT